jgi:hypothetical protein
MHHSRYFTLSRIVFGLFHSGINVKLLYSLALNMDARKTNYICISIGSAELLPSSAIISM